MKFNEGYFGQLAKSSKVENEVVDKAEKVADVVRRTAPVDTAEYVNNVRVEVEHTPHRVFARVVADVPHGMLVESKHGTMARALRSVSDG